MQELTKSKHKLTKKTLNNGTVPEGLKMLKLSKSGPHFSAQTSFHSVKMLDVCPHNWHKSSCTSLIQMEGFTHMGKEWKKITAEWSCQSWRRVIWTERVLARVCMVCRCRKDRAQTCLYFCCWIRHFHPDIECQRFLLWVHS